MECVESALLQVNALMSQNAALEAPLVRQQIEDRDEQLGPEDRGGHSTVAEVGVREIKATLMSWIPRHAAKYEFVHSGTSTKSLEGDSVADTSEIARVEGCTSPVHCQDYACSWK